MHPLSAFGAPSKAGDPRGLTTKIGAYLDVPVGARYVKQADGTTVKREYCLLSVSDKAC